MKKLVAMNALLALVFVFQVQALGAETVTHSADQNADRAIDLSELLRVIQFFNSDALYCEEGTEDGFQPGKGADYSCKPHDSDYNPRDWSISLNELLRLIQFYNSNGYHGECGTEDNFEPGQGQDNPCNEDVGIQLFGSLHMIVEAGQQFVDPGAFAYDAYDGELEVTAEGEVDTSTIGVYVITYSATDSSGNYAEVTRTVEVQDTTPPIITIIGGNPAYADINIEYIDAGAWVNDNCGGMINVSVVNTVDTSTFGDYTVTYTAIDSSGNDAQAVRMVYVVDQMPPVITIIGTNPVSAPLGGTYTDRGATAWDNYDGDVTADIAVENLVDTFTAGGYTVTYTVSDSHGNEGQAVRTVNVEPVAIVVTSVPTYGTTENLQGIVTGVDFELYHVAGYGNVEDVWWTKPSYAQQTVSLYADGTFTYDFTTGGNDIYATQFALYLLPIEITPPLCNPCFTLPEIPEELDSILVDRSPAERFVTFAGRSWEVKYRPYPAGPGGNYFSDLEDNVFVDGEGNLHLTITYDGTNWNCTEVIGQETFGYGTYLVVTNSRIDQLDKNVVFGAFTYDTTASGTAFNEIDMLEAALWGRDDLDTNMQNVLQPCNQCPGCGDHCHRFNVELTNEEPELTHYLYWQQGQIECRTYFGAYDLAAAPPAEMLANTWVYTGTDVHEPLSETFRFNTWLLEGTPPSDEQEVEITVASFDWQPGPPNWNDDTTPPEITIQGDNPVQVEALTAYTDDGATAWDDEDGDLTASIVVDSNVDTSTIGDYAVTYTVSDYSGNEAQAVRDVYVRDTTPPEITIEGENPMQVEVEPMGENLTVQITPAGLGTYIIGDVSLASRLDTAVDTDSNDNSHITYGSGADGLVYVTNAGGIWSRASSWSPAMNSAHNAIHVDDQDDVHICSVGWSNGEDLVYAENSGGSWNVEAVDTDASVGLVNDIVTNSNGVYIGYYDWAGNGLRLATNELGAWDVLALGNASQSPTSIMSDSQEAVHLVYGYSGVWHATNASGSWESEAVPSANDIFGMSAALDSQDNLYVLTGYNGLLTNRTGDWVQDDVFDQLFPEFGFSSLYLDEDSMALDNQGFVHICICAQPEPSVQEFFVYYISDILGYWETALVDVWATQDNHKYPPSIAVDSSDLVHVVYINTEYHDARYTFFDPLSLLGAR